MTQLYFSNDLYQLAECLAGRLFKDGRGPFSIRTILVPSERTGQFVQQFFAEHSDFQVAAGIRILTLPAWLLEQSLEQTGKKFPSYTTLGYYLYFLIKQKTIPALQGLSDHKIKEISQELSHLFHKYGIYGDAFLEDWLVKEGWQQTLFRSVYSDFGWTYPLSVIASIEKQKDHRIYQEPLHLFGFASMPSRYALLFKHSRAIFYLFSPCRFFWADLLTLQQRVARNILEEESSPLALWGKWGKRALNALSFEEMESEEMYREPLYAHTLGIVQKALLDLEEIPAFVEEEIEETLFFFSAKSLLQEVEEVYEKIHEWLKSDAHLRPSDILVLTPHMQMYAPYIDVVFGREERALDYVLLGRKQKESSLLFSAIKALFSLVQDKWSIGSLIELFFQPCFYQKTKWRKEELHQIERWLKKSKTIWGFDLEQRELYLGKRGVESDRGTLSLGLNRLLLGLTSTSTEASMPKPLEELQWTDIDLFSSLMEIVENLHKDLHDLVIDERKNMGAWIDWFTQISQKYFSSDELESVSRELFFYKEGFSSIPSPLYTWHDFYALCDELFSKTADIGAPKEMEAIYFDSLEEGSIIDKKIIVLIGMNESAFPRKDKESAFDELKNQAPSRSEIDRFLFLKALMKAKEKMCVSFLHICPERHIDEGPSLLILELIAFLQKIGVETTIQKLEATICSGEGKVRCSYFSRASYEKAKAYYECSIPPSRLIREWFEGGVLSIKEKEYDSTIDIRDLRDLLRDPLSFFFRKKHGFYLDKEPFFSLNEREFTLSRYARRKIAEKALFTSWEEALIDWRREGAISSSSFHCLAEAQIKHEHEILERALNRWKITPQEINHLAIEPYDVDMGGGKKVTLIGTIPNLSHMGIVELFETNKKEEVIAAKWSDLILTTAMGRFPREILFVQAKKEAVRRVAPCNVQEELRKIIDYYTLSKKYPSPFYPFFALSFLKGDVDGLSKALSKKEYLPKSLLWLIERDGELSPKVLIELWSPYLQNAFSALYHEMV